jgi:hypothetical protein
MIVAAAVGIGPAANIAQRMAHQLYMFPAERAKILRIPADDSAAAGPAARRIKPIEQPIDALRQSSNGGNLHGERELSKPERQVAKLK